MMIDAELIVYDLEVRHRDDFGKIYAKRYYRGIGQAAPVGNLEIDATPEIVKALKIGDRLHVTVAKVEA